MTETSQSGLDPKLMFPAVLGAGTALVMTKGQTPTESLFAGGAAGLLVYLLYSSVTATVPGGTNDKFTAPTLYTNLASKPFGADLDLVNKGQIASMENPSPGVVFVTMNNGSRVQTSEGALRELLATRKL